MQAYDLPNTGESNVVFNGELIGEASSREGNASRWFEARIYRTEGGNYVVCGVGRSAEPFEDDRYWVTICATGEEVVDALKRDENACAGCGSRYVRGRTPCEACGSRQRRPSGVRFLTRTAREALDRASAVDPVIEDAFVQRVA